MRKIEVDLESILDLINCAEDFGFAKTAFFSKMADLTGYVSDNEIHEYANDYLTDEMKAHGYTREDYNKAIETLTEWRDKYFNEV